jgi:hypothetical protein
MASIFPNPLIPMSGVMTVSPANYQTVGDPNPYVNLQARFFHTTVYTANLTTFTATGSLNEYLNIEFLTDPLQRVLLPGDFIWIQYGPQNVLSLTQVTRTVVGDLENYQLLQVSLT